MCSYFPESMLISDIKCFKELMWKCGLDEWTVRWIETWLRAECCEKWCRVLLEPVAHSAPQRSVLGPVVFSLLVSDPG